MPFAYRDDLTTADIAFVAWGRTLEELFSSAWLAQLEIMIPESASIAKTLTRAVTLRQSSPALLLVAFLNEALFFKDAEGILLLVDELEIVEDGDCRLEARLRGESIDGERHRLGTDVKAVTLHQFQFERTAVGYSATVVLDI